VRVRVALGVALALVAGALILDMFGRAPRIAGTDHTNPVGFVATVPSGGTVCQPGMLLAPDTGSIEVLIGTYGQVVPALEASFRGVGDGTLATGRLAGGAHEGYVRIPLRYSPGTAAPGTLCIRVGKVVRPVVFGGDVFTPGPVSEQVAGKPQGGRIDVVYLRPGRESWWQILGPLDERFGFGKASFFGDWTLPVVALLLLGTWIAVVRLLARELT
jgi:hypothetical protein